jgi:hypothetical protein
MKPGKPVAATCLRANEALRRRYRPKRVRLLLVGEAPPASGRFFYRANSGLYRAMQGAFLRAFPSLQPANFLQSFQDLGGYLFDLCAVPVDRLPNRERRQVCLASEARLCRALQALRPEIIITIVQSIAPIVRSAQQAARWHGAAIELPYPGRWKAHRLAFEAGLVPVLRNELTQHQFCSSRANSPSSAVFKSELAEKFIASRRPQIQL